MCGVKNGMYGVRNGMCGALMLLWGVGGGLPHRSQWGAVLPHCDPIAAAGLQFRSAPQGAAMGRPQWGQVGKPDRRLRER